MRTTKGQGGICVQSDETGSIEVADTNWKGFTLLRSWDNELNQVDWKTGPIQPVMNRFKTKNNWVYK